MKYINSKESMFCPYCIIIRYMFLITSPLNEFCHDTMPLYNN